MFILEHFTLDDMYRCSAELRELGVSATDGDEVASRVVSYLFERLRTESGTPACALVRLFRTMPWAALPESAKAALRSGFEREPEPEMLCLSLRATRGVAPDWNDPNRSRGHRFLRITAPVASPMVSALVAQLGFPAEAPFILRTEDKLCNVFHVEKAAGSPYVPEQAAFVAPYGIRSVLGFGGLLPGHEMFVVILFCSVHVPRDTADLFRPIAPSVGLALAASRKDPASLEFRLSATEELLRHHERIALFHCRQKEDLLSIASHELRSPLMALQLSIEQLMRSPATEFGERSRPLSLQRIERATNRLTTLAEELLDVSRGSVVRSRLDLEEVDLANVVADVVSGMQDLIARSGSKVTVRSSGATVGRWDRRRLDQLVTNLLSNALKFGAKKPILIVADSPARDVVRLRIRDHGIGIPLQEQSRIFERFQRAVSDRSYAGFGFGLWIVRQVVEAHGGTIEVTSAPGAGATFTVELPRSIASEASISPTVRAS